MAPCLALPARPPCIGPPLTRAWYQQHKTLMHYLQGHLDSNHDACALPHACPAMPRLLRSHAPHTVGHLSGTCCACLTSWLAHCAAEQHHALLRGCALVPGQALCICQGHVKCSSHPRWPQPRDLRLWPIASGCVILPLCSRGLMELHRQMHGDTCALHVQATCVGTRVAESQQPWCASCMTPGSKQGPTASSQPGCTGCRCAGHLCKHHMVLVVSWCGTRMAPHAIRLVPAVHEKRAQCAIGVHASRVVVRAARNGLMPSVMEWPECA